MSRAFVALILLLGGLRPAAAQAAVPSIEVNVDPSGRYEVRAPSLDWLFGGDIGQPLMNVSAADGQDALGAFHEISFEYLSGARQSSIRVYQGTSSVLFSTTYVAGGTNAEPFPALTSYPSLPYQLSFHDTPFSPYQLNTLAAASDSPWLFFDGGTGFIISPATHFLNARMTLDSSGLRSGIDPQVPTLPAGYTQQTLLVLGTGPNQLFDTWGTVLTGLHGKARPANDADLTLRKLGYWTDNGATYYYHFEPQLGYAGTLLGIKHEFDQRGIALGYVQLDSWWYPKGPNQRWDDKANGIFRYRAAADLFPAGLAAFQQQVGLPLVTHARWIDPTSPYRSEFSQGVSGNVMTDAGYWDDLMSYLHTGGVVTYEQDWLGAQAQPVYDLTAPQQFMGNMAAAAAQQGMTLQYCMPLPRHVLQSVEYGNVTTTRVSDDRFDRGRWDAFLYTSRLAGALGIWPWADVFMSTERDNLLLATLSGGVVGIGDALGAADAANLQHVMRADAVLVKPDAPIVPTDEAILAEAAQGATVPMVATTYSDHGAGLRDLYVFGYARGTPTQPASFAPSTLGVTGAAYVYDYFGDTGRLLDANERFMTNLGTGSYFIVAPLGASGIAFLGDAGEFASLGQKRISQLSDDGTLQASVEFAAGEQAVTLQGYAPGLVIATASAGVIDNQTYDPVTQRFKLSLHPDVTPSTVSVALTLNLAAQP